MQTYSQLCKEQRNTIENLLNKNFTFTEIGKSINVDRRTISREVKRNRIIKSSLYLPFSTNDIDMTPEDINIINKNIIPLIKDKRQSVNQVYINHPDILWISKPTFYKYVDLNVINLKNLDLPRKVKYKKRKNNKNKINKRESALLIGRTYEYYLERTTKDKKLIVWQLDTVIGKKWT